jgi:hypothetical protein
MLQERPGTFVERNTLKIANGTPEPRPANLAARTPLMLDSRHVET